MTIMNSHDYDTASPSNNESFSFLRPKDWSETKNMVVFYFFGQGQEGMHPAKSSLLYFEFPRPYFSFTTTFISLASSRDQCFRPEVSRWTEHHRLENRQGWERVLLLELVHLQQQSLVRTSLLAVLRRCTSVVRAPFKGSILEQIYWRGFKSRPEACHLSDLAVT